MLDNASIFYKQVGHFSLNVSTCLYFIYLIPQILHNLNGKNLKQLSLTTHGILFVAYILDLIYSFGRSMPWQYKAVSAIGLLCLTIQHFQINQNYHLQESSTNRDFQRLSWFIGSLCLIISAFILYHWAAEETISKSFFIGLGYISQVGWLSYALPQLLKNFKEKSAAGLSLIFIVLTLVIAICDSASAWLLDWDLPNKLGSPISVLIKLGLLRQCIVFWKNTKQRVQPLNGVIN